MKCVKIGMLMFLMVLAIASISMAAFVPVTSVTCGNPTGTAPYILQSLTVGNAPNTTVFPVDKLRFGTTTAGSGTTQARMDNYDLNDIFTGWAYPLQTQLFGGKDFYSTNGDKADFFLFEGAGTGSGNPDDVFIAPIFPDGTQGTPVALPTTINATGWGNTGYTIAPTFPQAGQVIAGVSWDITDMKDATDKFLSPNAVIKGIRITSGGGIDPAAFLAAVPLTPRGGAHTPVPADEAKLVNQNITSVSWYSPLQDSSGAPKPDPNIVAVTGYKVWFGTVEPNEVTQLPTPITTTGKSFPVTLGFETTYYWRVDTLVTWNASGFDPVVKGLVWKFTTKPNYIVPEVAFNSVITTLPLVPAKLSASVANNTNAITGVTFTLLTDDIQYPAGAVASVTKTSTDNQNPKADLTTDMAGLYKVKLVVTDGITPVEKIAEVVVYADECAAKKASPSGWMANVVDRNNDCIVDLDDFALLSQSWLNNTGIIVSQPYTGSGSVNYIPLSVLNARVEAESVNPADPNGVSDFPITDATGVRINDDASAIGGGKALGYTGAGTFAQYTIDIPAAGKYDLHLYTSAPAAGGGLDFGVAGTPALYGSVTNLPGTVWTTYYYTVHPGALTFTASGPTVVRITWTGAARNLDWFTLVKQ